MRFYSTYERKDYLEIRKSVRDAVVLSHSNWNDWFQFETIFGVEYIDSEGELIQIGRTKIGKVGMEGAEWNQNELQDQRIPSLEKTFTELDNLFFSLGQDVSFYENLMNLPSNKGNQILRGLNDIAYDEENYKVAISERVTKVSLLRNISTKSVTGQLRRLSRGDSKLSSYSFKYISSTNIDEKGLELSFNVQPNSNPSTNIHIIIGRNGVGKTHLMNGMINSLIKKNDFENGYFVSNDENITGSEIFANLIFVSFSAFDENTPIKAQFDDIESIKYTYVGLKRLSKSGSIISKSTNLLKSDFSESLGNCIKLNKISLWGRIIEILYSDPIFKRHAPLAFMEFNPKKISFVSDVETLFNKYSSGHRIVLLTITKIIESIEEKSLIILDEPESHLHPPLLASFTKALSKLLIARNGVGIIGTHSPVIVQEVPNSCIWKLSRHGASSKVERFEQETFGENVGSLTKELFGLEVMKSGFYNLIEESVKNSADFAEVIDSFDCDLGMEAQAIARILLSQKNSDNAEN